MILWKLDTSPDLHGLTVGSPSFSVGLEILHFIVLEFLILKLHHGFLDFL
jgi:hypothetical protein